MSKQLVCQKFIYKIHSSRLRKEKWRLSLPIDEARRNDEVISLADSQVLRWIDELNGVTDSDTKAREIKMRIRQIKKEPNCNRNTREIRKLYAELDKLQFQPDYMCLIIDKTKDYHRACKGFSINGISYKRLLGTNGGIKNSTIVFVSERVHDEITRRIENGRDPQKGLVTAKLEAYKALTCSASNPVSFPNGIAVVDDAETEFLSDIIYLTDEVEGEPLMEFRRNEIIKLDASDGFGLMLPQLSARWSEELGLDYMMCGCNTRFAFEKGMAFTFDFRDFAEHVAGKYIIKDAWGNDVDVRNVELILTTSMVKLWDSYKDCDDYIANSLGNNYAFGVTKTCPKVLENERALNYQFIQSYDLSDDDIDKLIKPTVDEIKDVLGGDWRKTVLFLRGAGLNENNVERIDDDYIKAIMIDRRVMDDPFVRNNIYRLIKNRINEAKVGVLKVHGNYSILSGDPYLLCQSMFGMDKTGLLKAGEIYNKYWSDSGSERVACFRAPMSCHNNIRIMHPKSDDNVDYWYRYMNACTILNGWDTTCAALNGCDFDGDLVMVTDNEVLVKRARQLPALVCAQRKAEKKVSTEADFIQSNIDSFGNEIGRTTNWITSMYDVQAQYDKGTPEYETLEYRIQCGQLYQQNVIDKAKGIISKPMPDYWHDRRSARRMSDETDTDMNMMIVADKKPYFMRYIYPSLMREYNSFISNSNKKSERDYGVSLKELYSVPECDRTPEQNEFIRFFEMSIPVSTNDCVMNRICRKFEDIFDGYVSKKSTSAVFDYRFMRSDGEYTPKQYYAIKNLYEDYCSRVANYKVYASSEKIDSYDSNREFDDMNDAFVKECSVVCSDEKALCNIVLDLCYKKSSTKRFAWKMSGGSIIENLLDKNDYKISYPTLSDDGDIWYGGNRFEIRTKEAELVQ